MKINFSWRVFGIFVAIWIVAAGAVWILRVAQPTPASIQQFVNDHPLEGLPPDQRLKVIDKIAAKVNRLDFEQRQQLRKNRTDRNLFKEMTEPEQRRFFDMTLPEGFRQLMLALNNMEPARRRKIVSRAMKQLEKDDPDAMKRLDDEMVQKVINQGMDSFYSEANAEVKLEFAPLIEQIQRTTQRLR